MMFFFLFFFQAEDGIRDIGVTGVQTCALPIYVPLRNGIELVLTLGGVSGSRRRIVGRSVGCPPLSERHRSLFHCFVIHAPAYKVEAAMPFKSQFVSAFLMNGFAEAFIRQTFRQVDRLVCCRHRFAVTAPAYHIDRRIDRKSTRLNSSYANISY